MSNAADRRSGVIASGLLLAIGGYRRFISPLLGPHCRFYPSCSEYAVRAIGLHGAGRGVLLAAGRLSRCHPWNPGGFDPVPEEDRARSPYSPSVNAVNVNAANVNAVNLNAVNPGATRC